MAATDKYKYTEIIGIGVLAILLQIFFIPLIEIGIWRPDLIILVLIYCSFRYGVIPGTLTGFILGIIQDSLSASPIGISSLANSIIGFIAGQTRQIKISTNGRFLITILLILLQGIIFYIFYQFKTEVGYLTLLLTRVFPNTIYTFAIGVVFAFILRSKLKIINE